MENKPDYGLVIDLLEGFRKSKILLTAVKLGIFDAIQIIGSSSSNTLANHLTLSPDGVERLLNACVALSLLETETKSNSVIYKLNSVSEKYLTSSSSDNFIGYIRHSNDVLYPLWQNLDTSVKTGEPSWEITFGRNKEEIFNHLYKSEEDLDRFISGMHSFSKLSSSSVIKSFDLSSFHHMIDLGGATGALVFEAIKSYPDLKGTVVDLPSVTNNTLKYLQKQQEEYSEEIKGSNDEKSVLNLLDRIQIKSSDFFSDDLPDGDLYVLSRILHDWNEKKIQIILQKIYDKLESSGGLLIAEMLLDESRQGPSSALLQSLNMLVQTEGKERSGSEYSSLLTKVGFQTIKTYKTGSYLDVVLAIK